MVLLQSSSESSWGSQKQCVIQDQQLHIESAMLLCIVRTFMCTFAQEHHARQTKHHQPFQVDIEM